MAFAHDKSLCRSNNELNNHAGLTMTTAGSFVDFRIRRNKMDAADFRKLETLLPAARLSSPNISGSE